MEIDALIFDVDGTLADTEEAHRVAFNLAFQARHLGWTWSRDDYRGLLQVTGGKERIAHYIDTLPVAAAERRRLLASVPEVHQLKTRFYSACVADGAVPLRDGVANLIEDAHAAGCLLAIASTTTAVNIDALLRATLGPCGLDMFSCIACGDQVRAKKPAPDVYLLALRAMDMRPQRALALEDSVHGLQAARAAGLRTVVTPNHWTEGGDFSAATLVLPGLGALRSASSSFDELVRQVSGQTARATLQ